MWGLRIMNEELRIKKIQNSEFRIQRDVDWDVGIRNYE